MPTDELRSLPAVLRRASSDAAAVDAMRAELACAWRALFWTSLHGSCFGEAPRGDAFELPGSTRGLAGGGLSVNTMS